MNYLADVLCLHLAGDATPWSTAAQQHTSAEIDEGVRVYTRVRHAMPAPRARRLPGAPVDMERCRYRPWRKSELRTLEKAIYEMP